MKSINKDNEGMIEDNKLIMNELKENSEYFNAMKSYLINSKERNLG